jgi:hypothetical protein
VGLAGEDVCYEGAGADDGCIKGVGSFDGQCGLEFNGIETSRTWCDMVAMSLVGCVNAAMLWKRESCS